VIGEFAVWCEMGCQERKKDREPVLMMCVCRAPIDESRKWAIYYITNLLFKTYFKVSISWKKERKKAAQEGKAILSSK